MILNSIFGFHFFKMNITLVHQSLLSLLGIQVILVDRLILFHLDLHVHLFFQQNQHYPLVQEAQQRINLVLPLHLSLIKTVTVFQNFISINSYPCLQIILAILSNRLFQGFLLFIKIKVKTIDNFSIFRLYLGNQQLQQNLSLLSHLVNRVVQLVLGILEHLVDLFYTN